MADSAMILLKTSMDMYQAQYTATDKLWAYFSTVSLALVAYTISSDKVARVVPEAVVAVGTYLIFCIGNFAAICLAQRQLQSLAELVKVQGQAHGLKGEAFEVFSVAQVSVFYWLIVAVIVSASLWLARHRQTHGPAGGKSS